MNIDDTCKKAYSMYIMSAEYIELPLRATRFIAIADEVSQLEATAAENPNEAHLYDDAIGRGKIKMQMLEEDAAEAFIAVAECVEPDEVTRQRTMIESLRDDEDFGVVITEDDIQASLANLPSFVDYHPEVRSFVAGYFAKIGELSLANSLETFVVSADGEVDVPSGIPAGTESLNGNKETGPKPDLTIRIYKDRVIQVGDDGEFVSMFRDVDIPKTSEEEEFIADARIQALKTITDIDGVERGVPSRDVWNEYAGFAEYSTGWHNIVIEPLVTLSHDGKPIIDVRRPSPVAKRRYHSNGAFNVNFVEVDQRAPYDNREIIALPNGKYLFGLRARAVHLLLRANEDMPFTTKLAETSDLYSPEELENLTDGINASSVISYLRRTLDEVDEFTLQSVKFEDRSMGYWLEYNGDDTDLYPFLNPDNLGDDEPERTARQTTSEATGDYEQSLAQVSSLAGWLLENKDLLTKHGLPQLDDADALAIISQAKQAGVEPIEVDSFEFRKAMLEMSNVLSDEAAIEEVIEKVPSDDPRWKLIDYLTEAVDSCIVAEALINQFAEFDMRIDADLLELDIVMKRWRNLSNKERIEGVKYSYDLFHRIGEMIKEQNGVPIVDFGTILKLADKRLNQTSQASGGSSVGFSQSAYDALTAAPNPWSINGNNRGQRELRRSWANELRTILNRQTSSR